MSKNINDLIHEVRGPLVSIAVSNDLLRSGKIGQNYASKNISESVQKIMGLLDSKQVERFKADRRADDVLKYSVAYDLEPGTSLEVFAQAEIIRDGHGNYELLSEDIDLEILWLGFNVTHLIQAIDPDNYKQMAKDALIEFNSEIEKKNSNNQEWGIA